MADRLDEQQKRVVLQPLAEAMMSANTRDFPSDETRAAMTPALIEVGFSESDIPAFMLDLCAISSGLLIENEVEVWSFAHFTFQEYLCASHWKQTGETKDWDMARWQTLISDSWWHETLRLYAAQTRADPLTLACLALDTDKARQLAGELEREALKLRPETREAVKLALSDVVAIKLRTEPMVSTWEDAKEKFGLQDHKYGYAPLEYIQNEYVDKGETVFDKATGLYWQKSGSDSVTFEDAVAYKDRINTKKFDGFKNWRLPTVPELISLLEPETSSNGLYINPLFDNNQTWCWTCDRKDSSSGPAFLVYFHYGSVGWDLLYGKHYVRLVRS